MDDVLSETAKSVVNYFGWELRGHPISFEWWSSYYLWGFLPFELSIQESEKIFHDVFMSDKDNLDMPKLPWSYEKLKKLKEEWHEFHLISARDVASIEYSHAWLEAHFPWIFSSVNFIKDDKVPFDNKWELCKHLWIDLMIDDSIDFSENVAEHWTDVLLMERPWNSQYNIKSDKIKRITSWEEVIL